MALWKKDKNKDKGKLLLKQRVKNKLISLWQWLRKNILNKEMFLSVVIAELIFWSPVIVTGLLAIIINPWWWTVCTAIILFWAGPFTPAVPLQIGLAFLIKKLSSAIKRKIKKNKEGKENGTGNNESDDAAAK